MWRWFVLSLSCLLLSGTQARAEDVRVALLVGNQDGWRGEQRLPWVLSGDLLPIERTFKRLGYRVITLQNATAAEVRKQMHQLHMLASAQKITTFLFYYSGHADKRFFHFGPKKKSPLSYREFLAFILKLPVKRRFVILDACHGGNVIPLVQGKLRRARKSVDRTPVESKALFQFINQQLPAKQRFADSEELQLWFSLRLPKGVRRPKRSFDFQRTPFLRREEGAGLHMIGTIGTAWHDPSLKASLMSAYLLKGLEGAADNVKDGRITIEELYNYVQARLQQKGQRLNRFVLFNGSYTLAPNTQSSLQMASEILGSINVSIGQFTWHYKKKDLRRIAIPTIHGRGTVEIKHRGRCWKQSLSFPKGKSARLIRYGERTECQTLLAQRKGGLFLQAEPAVLPPEPSAHVLGVSAGFSQLGQAPLSTSIPFFSLGYRHHFFGLSLDYYLGQPPQNRPFAIHRAALQLELGLPLSIVEQQWHLFVGGYLRGGGAFTALEAGIQSVFSAGAGALVDINYWFQPHIGFRLGSEAGLDYTPVVGLSGLSFQWKVRISVLLRL